MKLYEFGPTRSLRVRWTLQELGVEFESVPIDLRVGEHRRPEFLALNPAGKLPVLVDGDLVLTESAAIVLYLAEKYPDRKLVPADPATRAEHYRWLLFAVTELEQPLWRITRNTVLYPKELRLPGDVEQAGSEFRAMAEVLERHMQGREWVAGDSVTVADFVTAYTLDWANEFRLLGDCPRLSNYLEQMYSRAHAPPRIAAAVAAVKTGEP
jgi:glutathione S-transferase